MWLINGAVRPRAALHQLSMTHTVTPDWREAAFASLSEREWPAVETAVAAIVRGDEPLPGEPGAVWEVRSETEKRAAKDARIAWRLAVAYFGPAFSGFAWQPAASKPTVEGCLQEAMRPLLDGTTELRLECAGRTDAGVSSVGQLVSFHSWAGVSERELADAITKASPLPGALRLVSARRMGRNYHATYSTTWRRYCYLLPAPPGTAPAETEAEAARIDALLRPLAGETRDFAPFGRSVPEGKDTNMILRHASARLVELKVVGGDGPSGMATRIDLVGDRFLRQQVRTLVGTAVALAESTTTGASLPQPGEPDTRLLEVCESGQAERTAHPAPAVGLVLAEAGTDDELDPSWHGTDEESYEADAGAEEAETAQLISGFAADGAQPAYAAETPEAAFTAALTLLEQQSYSGAPLDALMRRHVRANGLGQDARSSITSYLDGVVRCQARLDARLEAAGCEVAPRTRLLASTKLCGTRKRGGRSSRAGGMSSILNAKLITPTEQAWLDQLKPPLEDDGMPIASRLECPAWAWPSFVAAFGEAKVEQELRALQPDAPLDLRVNTLKATRSEALAAIRAAGFTAEPAPYSPVGIRLKERAVVLGQVPGLLEGVVEPQDEGSQLLALLVGAQPGEYVVDYCAGAGGKTLALAAQMNNKGKLLAADINEALLERSAPRLVKAAVDNVERHVIEQGKDKWLKRRKRTFDRVLVDAPCSGVGAWRRNPDARFPVPSPYLPRTFPVPSQVHGGATQTRAGSARRVHFPSCCRSRRTCSNARRGWSSLVVRWCTRRARCSWRRMTSRSRRSSPRRTGRTLS